MNPLKMTAWKRWKCTYIALAAFLVAAAVFGVFRLQSLLNRQDPEIETAPNNIYKETIVVAADADYQPYSFYSKDDKPSGYDIELIYKLADRLHKNVEIRLMQWSDACRAVESGDADVLMGLDYNLESLNNFELSMPLDNDPFVAFGRESFRSVDDLSEKKIATLENSGSFSAFLTPYQLDENTATYASYTQAFQSVIDGENDYAIAMYSVGRRTLAKLDYSSINATGPTLAGNYLCIGVRKGNTTLMDELNGGIIQLKKDGTLDDLGTKWLGRYVEIITVSDFFLKHQIQFLIGGIVLLIAGIFTYLHILRRLASSAAAQYEMTKKVLQYQQLLTAATKGLYESIYELDITHNCAGGESTEQYFQSLGIPANTPLDEALKTIADKQIKEDFIPGYLNTFLPEHVLNAYAKGIDSLSYDFMISSNGSNYYWMRITARIFFWSSDQSVRMIVYRQNIDTEKKKEIEMSKRAYEDPLTALSNKVTTEQLIRRQLDCAGQSQYAFIMLDIDNFKSVNDNLGHAFGDYTIVQVARNLRRQITPDDILGRVGGDEFTLFLPFPDFQWLQNKVRAINSCLCKELRVGENSCIISVSMGLSFYPQDGTDFDTLYQKADEALYWVKRNGKNGFQYFCDGAGEKSGLSREI